MFLPIHIHPPVRRGNDRTDHTITLIHLPFFAVRALGRTLIADEPVQ